MCLQTMTPYLHTVQGERTQVKKKANLPLTLYVELGIWLCRPGATRARPPSFYWLPAQACRQASSAVANRKIAAVFSTPSGKISPIPSGHRLPPRSPPTTDTTNPFPHTHTPHPTMPRQSRPSARPAPTRPTVPARSAAPTQQQQTRPATTYAPSAGAPPTAMAPPQAASQGPGLMGQMASTAAYAPPSSPPHGVPTTPTNSD